MHLRMCSESRSHIKCSYHQKKRERQRERGEKNKNKNTTNNKIEEKRNAEGHWKFLEVDIFVNLVMGMVTQVHIYIQTQQIIY